MKVTSFSSAFFDLVIHFECSGNIGKYLKAYKDIAGIWTIGIGTVYYPDGTRVKSGDVCTEEQAKEYFLHHIKGTPAMIDATTPDTISQGMFDAIGDFVYNEGDGAWRSSTLHKIIVADPTNFPKIQENFYVWNKARVNGELKESSGLTRRRKCEYYLYKNGVNHPTFYQA